MSTEIQRCRSCGQLIYWLQHERTGKLAPIEAEARDDGNVLIDLAAGSYGITFKGHHHINHFMTCPQGGTWSKAGQRKAGGR